MVTGDEHLNGNDPSRELSYVRWLSICSHSRYSLEFSTIESSWIFSKIAYNALPATIDKELLTHQYDQQVNQIIAVTPNAIGITISMTQISSDLNRTLVAVQRTCIKGGQIR